MSDFQYILVEPQHRAGVALIRLNRPKELNALNRGLMGELAQAVQALDADASVRCIVLTGSEKAFAAGADIKEMADAGAIEMLKRDQFRVWDSLKSCKKPILASVSGFCLGGGCEVAMLCDLIIAGDNAKFGQPEIKLGVIPGAGGTQRLTHAIGKGRAMELVLTGKFISAEEAVSYGLANRVVPAELCLAETVKLAEEIAAMPPIAVQLGKECVLQAFEGPLSEGLKFERKNFYLLFASADQREGMAAFVEKRKPIWKGE